MIKVNRSNIILKADPGRVVLLSNSLGIRADVISERAARLVSRILELPEAEVDRIYEKLHREFNHRHRKLEATFQNIVQNVRRLLPSETPISEKRKLLLGAHFAKEYSIQSAALFNPSIVPHPDQQNLNDGEKRFIISLRSVGEGHISSIEFREGIVSGQGAITLSPITSFSSRIEKDPSFEYDKKELSKRTARISNFDKTVFDPLSDHFTQREYEEKALDGIFDQFGTYSQKLLSEFIDTNYDLLADESSPLCERVIFPSAKGECMGMEDVRFVEFTNEDGKKKYIGTYTAYNGFKITPQLIITKDFKHFQIRTMFGEAVSDKGFALFPQKINGKYMMTARQGGEDLTIMESEDLYNWNEFQVIMRPEYSWGLVQQGNCGSPIKTKSGWLLITHAVGPLRKYVISAILLDLEDPQKIIGKLREPLISPQKNEREGYVPNVVYSCGAMAHKDNLIIPYAMSDSASSFATISISEILENMKE